MDAVENRGKDKAKSKKNDPEKMKGCALSFLMEERGELGGICGGAEPDPAEEYVQPDKEKEAGGEG
jgi:hypothetical protein